MAAIDSTSKVIFYEYKNRELILKTYSFPTAMSGKQIRDFFNFTETPVQYYPYKDNPIVTVYVNPNKKDKVQEYYLEVDMFFPYKTIIMCKGFNNLVHLMQELKPYLDFRKNS
jgi:hypothetical protein